MRNGPSRAVLYRRPLGRSRRCRRRSMSSIRRPNSPSPPSRWARRRTSIGRSAPPEPPLTRFSRTTREDRLGLLRRILDRYNSRAEDLAEAVSREMGAPLTFAREAQVWAGRVHLEATIEALEAYEFSRLRGTSLIVKEPIGVAALITPWNWPLNQIVCKVAPALAAGCTVVLKPSEIAPISGIVVRRNRRSGGRSSWRVQSRQRHRGRTSGRSWRAIRTSTWCLSPARPAPASWSPRAAADTVKRVAQELGGKSPNIILRDADFEPAVRAGRRSLFLQQRSVLRRADPDACPCRTA